MTKQEMPTELTNHWTLQHTYNELFNRWGRHDIARDVLYEYINGNGPAHFPVPAIQTRVEYIFQGFAIDGIFVRVEDYIVAGAYKDGMELIGYPCIPYSFDYPDQD